MAKREAWEIMEHRMRREGTSLPTTPDHYRRRSAKRSKYVEKRATQGQAVVGKYLEPRNSPLHYKRTFQSLLSRFYFGLSFLPLLYRLYSHSIVAGGLDEIS